MTENTDLKLWGYWRGQFGHEGTGRAHPQLVGVGDPCRIQTDMGGGRERLAEARAYGGEDTAEVVEGSWLWE